jgi:hypothetical protein
MAWTTPGTAVAGSVLSSAFWNLEVRDNLNALNDVGLTIGSGTTAQTGSFNADMTYDAASITLSTNGRYLIYASVSITNSVSDQHALGIWNNTSSALVANSVGTAVQSDATDRRILVSRPVVVTVSSSTVFRPRVQRNGGSTITVPAISAGLASSSSGWIAALLIGY